jgi:hypothetical protein
MSGLLLNLPSAGTCTAARPGSHGGLPPTYVAVHDTAAPPEQVIGTDATNLLIRTLTIKKQREESARKEAEAAGKGKRKEGEGGAGGSGSGAPAAKRVALEEGGSGGAGGALTRGAARNLDVKALKAELAKKGLPVGGNKARARSEERERDPTCRVRSLLCRLSLAACCVPPPLSRACCMRRPSAGCCAHMLTRTRRLRRLTRSRCASRRFFRCQPDLLERLLKSLPPDVAPGAK